MTDQTSVKVWDPLVWCSLLGREGNRFAKLRAPAYATELLFGTSI